MRQVLILFLMCFSVLALADDGPKSTRAICGVWVANKYLPEIKVPDKTDKYFHCSVSCVMTLYCGFTDSIEVGILKEIYDALGYGEPSLEDLKADLKGIRLGMKIRPRHTRPACYQGCSSLYP